MTIPDNPEALQRRKPTAVSLTDAGFPTSEKTLATMASRGDGPPYHLYGRYPLYRWRDVLAWAQARLKPARNSTSAHQRVVETVRSGGRQMTPGAASGGAEILCSVAAEPAWQSTQFLTSDPQTSGARPPISQSQMPGGSDMAAKKKAHR